MPARAYPLVIADFWLTLPIRSVSFNLSAKMRMSETGGGEIITSGLGPRLWTGTVEGAAAQVGDQRKFEVMLESLQEPGASFYAFDPSQPYPAGDPDGTIIGATSPAIAQLDADARMTAIDGLPAGYTLKAGTMFSYFYSATPTLLALHRVRDDVTADGLGQTPLFEVNPPIRPGAAVDTAVRFDRPICKAIMVPGSLDLGSRGRVIAGGFSFTWQQTLR